MALVILSLIFFFITFVAVITGIIFIFIKSLRRAGLFVLGGSVLTISLAFVLMLVAFLTDDKPQSKNKSATTKIEQEKAEKKEEKDSKEKAKKEKKEKEKKEKEQLNFKGSMKMKVIDGKKILVEIESNAPDGTIFETTILNGDLKVQSEFIKIKDGKILKEFAIPNEWKPGYIGSFATVPFNLLDHPQPDHIKKIYGENGEKMTGELTSKNSLGGKNAEIKVKPILYPDEKTVKAALDESFNDAINELKNKSNGIIIDVLPRSSENWLTVNVVVSDAWYYSPEHEKERFAEQMGQTVKNIVTGTEKAEGAVSVYFVDTYGKDLAKPKILGGYKIKK